MVLTKPIVSLRSAGDIILLLPLARKLALTSGCPARIVVHRNYEGIFDGISYAVPILWDGNMEDPLAACRAHNGINAQVTGVGLDVERRYGDFAKRAWEKLGFEWNRHWRIEFDRRDMQRESALRASAFKTKLPKILVKMHSFSSPFVDGAKLRQLLISEFSGFAEIVWLDDVRAERIYDLVGLMDEAACLVSVDTVTLWLAKASGIPVVALVNPEPFLASPPTGNVILRLPYTEALMKWDSIAVAVHAALMPSRDESIVLAFQDFKSPNLDTLRRQETARATWINLPARLYAHKPNRTSLSLGDPRECPYVKDIIDGAIATGSEGIIAITNTDIRFDVKLHQAVLESCRRFGCYWSYRLDNPGGRTDNGADFFAFTRRWWFMHGPILPDFLIGYYWWDDHMVRMMRWCGCTERERLTYHEPHWTFPHEQQLSCIGGRYNTSLAIPWIEKQHDVNQKPEE